MGRHAFGYALITPAAIFMLVVHVAPTIGGIYVAFLRLNLFTYSLLFDAPFVGLENFRDLLLDADNPVRSGLWNATRNTLLYTGYTLTATLVLAMAIALLLARQFRGARVLRTLMLAPWVVPSFVVAILWQFMWQSEAGIVNKVLVDYTHLLDGRPVWLLGPNSLWAIVIPAIWRGLPFVILVFLAGLQAIPRELYEAASIDGANRWQQFRSITMPSLRAILLLVVTLQVIASFQLFGQAQLMTGGGPPSELGGETNPVLLHVYNTGFGGRRELSLGAAMALIVAAMMMVVSIINFRLFSSERS